MIGGSAKGDRPLSDGPMGEFTDVASANRAVRGVLRDGADDDSDDVRALVVTFGPFFSSAGLFDVAVWSKIRSCFGAFDIALCGLPPMDLLDYSQDQACRRYGRTEMGDFFEVQLPESRREGADVGNKIWRGRLSKSKENGHEGGGERWVLSKRCHGCRRTG